MDELSPTFCKLPWTNINTTPQGSCKLCCNIADERTIMDWRDTPRTVDWGTDDIESIWNGSYLQDVRTKMLLGQPVHDCEGCYNAESIGNTSSRQATNAEDYYSINGSYEVIAKELPMSLELRLTNRCNLTCHSCWGGSSSKILELRQQALALNESSELVIPVWLRGSWHGEIASLSRKNRFYGKSDDYIVQPKSFENFAKLAPTLRRLYITGGEPTMDRTIHTYLDALVKTNNWGCFVGWTTNCTLWNEPLMEKLGYFSNTELQLSVDAFGTVNEYIRRPTVWEDVAGNIERYMLDDRVKLLKMFTVISALNAACLIELIDWLRDTANRTRRAAIWWPITLKFPEHQDVLALNRDKRMSIASELESYLNGSEDDVDYLDYKDGLRNTINLLRQETSVDSHKLGKQLREYLDYSDALEEKLGNTTMGWRKALPHLELGQ